MRRWYLVLALLAVLAIASCSKKAEAREQRDPCDGPFASIMNECLNVPAQEENYEPFDYGVYAQLILWEGANKDWEVGVFNTYEVQRQEATSLIGGKIYFNRLFWQKDEVVKGEK